MQPAIKRCAEMRVNMKYEEAEIADKKNNKHKQYIWMIIMAVVMSCASFISYIYTCGDNAANVNYMVIAMSVGIITAAVTYMLCSNTRWRLLIFIIPVLISVIPAGLTGIINGAGIYIDIIISDWNRIHADGVGMLPVTGGQYDLLAFSLLISVIIGELSFCIIYYNAIIQGIIYALFFIAVQLICGNISVLSCALLIAVCIIMNIAGKTAYITFRSVILSVIVMLVLLLSVATGNKELVAVRTMRDDVNDKIDDIRYGTDSMPEGDITRAGELLSDNQELLKLWSEQSKNIYLKGYVGMIYDEEESRWRDFSNSYYGGDNYGMLDWLYENGLNPLTQSSSYYNLDNSGNRPLVNRLHIEIKNSTRRFVYVPESVSLFVDGKVKNNKDISYISKGLFGLRKYDVEEISDTHPSELITAGEWLDNPQTDEQKQYIKAESVYRDFVYDNYTQVTTEYYDLMNKLFWNDYNTDSSGIYEAVSRVRKVLKEKFTYNEYPVEVPDNTQDALEWYIKEAGEGNAVIYSSIAVQALRAVGIPSRYVEGYYISSSDISKNYGDGVSLTGENAHAWVEVYFDGIGWKPVDVTPGYYYESAVLQQMVNAPDNMYKTAAFDVDKSLEHGKVVDNVSNNHKKADKILPKAVNTGVVVAGIIAVIIILITLILTIIEVSYYFVYSRQLRMYRNSSSAQKARIIEKRIHQLFRVKGIDATLGWHTKEIDEIVSQSIKNVEPGDYIRACEIMEKVVYGGCELEPYELRTLEIFADEVFADHAKEAGVVGYKVRHIAFGIFGKDKYIVV